MTTKCILELEVCHTLVYHKSNKADRAQSHGPPRSVAYGGARPLAGLGHVCSCLFSYMVTESVTFQQVGHMTMAQLTSRPWCGVLYFGNYSGVNVN